MVDNAWECINSLDSVLCKGQFHFLTEQNRTGHLKVQSDNLSALK